jgi:hypothetical protein
MQKPGRPLGVTLAIAASVMLFTVFPLIIVTMVVLVNRHFSQLDFAGSGIEPIAMGGDFMGVAPESLAIQTIISLAFLVIAVLAWRGRPASIRSILLGAVIGMTVISFVTTVIQSLGQPDVAQGVSSLNSLASSLSCGQLVLSTLVSLYVVWYLNRGPARAFYRGYYLPDPANPTNTPSLE